MNKIISQKFRKACKDYHLLENGDRILIAVSGGKDSLALLNQMAAQARIYIPKIYVEAVHIVMDNIPYQTDETYLKHFCDEQGVKLNIIHTSYVEHQESEKGHCFLCSWYRRKAIFKYAQENNFNKVALGHHMDDFIITALLNLSYEGQFFSMKPMMEMEHYPIKIIRPLCPVHENMIVALSKVLGFVEQIKKCPYENTTNRKKLANIFHQLEDDNKEVRFNFWKAISSTF